MPIVSGFIAVTDVTDGQAGFSIVFSNENHTFSATTTGSIQATELAEYNNVTTVFQGADPLSFNNTASPTTAQWSISNGTLQGAAAITQSPTNAGLDVYVNITSTSSSTVTNAAGTTITLATPIAAGGIVLRDNSADVDGFADTDGGTSDIDAVTLTIPVRVRNDNGTFTSINRTISLSKARGGSAPFVRVAANAQVVEYAFQATAPTSPTSNLIFSAVAPNIVGTFVWEYFVGTPTATSTFIAVPAAQGTTSGTDDAVLTVSYANYNALLTTVGSPAAGSNSITFRARRGTNATAIDQVTVARLFDASPAYTVQITPSASTVFKNNQGTITLTADLLEGGTVITAGSSRFTNFTPGGGSTSTTPYRWRKNGTLLTSANQADGTAGTGVTQNTGEGFDQRVLRVSALGITDNASELWTCDINYT